MKDVIKEILEANEKAQNDIENIKELKDESLKRIENARNKQNSEYIDKARMNIKVIKKIEDSKAEIEIEKIKQECEKSLNQINNIYIKNKDLWINNIFNNIVGKL